MPFRDNRCGCNHNKTNLGRHVPCNKETDSCPFDRFAWIMIRPFLLRLFMAAAAVSATGAAWAQADLCQRYRAELAALDQGGGRQALAAAEQQRIEIARLSSYYRSIGCERGLLGGIFGGSAPAECGAISQRIRQMEASYAALSAQAGPGNSDVRRRQLMAAISQTCAPTQEAAAPRGFFESIFGAPRGTVPQQGVPGMEGQPLPGAEQRPMGGGRLVCVRTCDGYFFPLSSAPGGRQNADEMCQALCPGSETVAFSMGGSDDALSRAISLRGTPYASLPNAFRYTKGFDESCSCKKEGQSWASLLRQAESMLGERRGDIFVTAEKSEEMSRPKLTPAQAKEQAKDLAKDQARDKKAAAQKGTEADESREAAEQGAAAPTASQDSSGIGPQSIENSRVVGTGEGPKQELPTETGKRRIRVIAPDIIPVPQTK
jgi:hypothetical protein